MKNRRQEMSLYDWILLLMVGLIIGAATCSASSQARVSPQLALARICVSEEGFPIERDGRWVHQSDTTREWGAGCWAIHEVYVRGANRLALRGSRAPFPSRYISFASAYSHRVIGPNQPSRPWLVELVPSGRAPASWPAYHSFVRRGERVQVSHAPWSAYQRSWQYVYQLAGEIVPNDIDTIGEWSRCSRPVHHWGGDMDQHRAERAGWLEVDCGQTANHFYYAQELDAEEVDVD